MARAIHPEPEVTRIDRLSRLQSTVVEKVAPCFAGFVAVCGVLLTIIGGGHSIPAGDFGAINARLERISTGRDHPLLPANHVYAIISDIHGNLEALETVMGEIERRNITEIYCLGDVIGYGASPKECLDTVIERCKLCVCGNHDHACFYEPSNFNVGAERACFWTRQVFEDESNKALRNRRWEFLGKLPIRVDAKDLLMVHASPRRPVNEYLFAEDVYTNPSKILANFERLESQHKACVVGHTHVPGVFLDDPYFDPPHELREPNFYSVTEDEQAIINVGSVGQPRDRDPRACFVVVHEKGETIPYPDHVDGSNIDPDDNGYISTLEFVRLEYDVQKAVQKVLDTPDLDDFLGLRLTEGR